MLAFKITDCKFLEETCWTNFDLFSFWSNMWKCLHCGSVAFKETRKKASISAKRKFTVGASLLYDFETLHLLDLAVIMLIACSLTSEQALSLSVHSFFSLFEFLLVLV